MYHDARIPCHELGACPAVLQARGRNAARMLQGTVPQLGRPRVTEACVPGVTMVSVQARGGAVAARERWESVQRRDGACPGSAACAKDSQAPAAPCFASRRSPAAGAACAGHKLAGDHNKAVLTQAATFDGSSRGVGC